MSKVYKFAREVIAVLSSCGIKVMPEVFERQEQVKKLMMVGDSRNLCVAVTGMPYSSEFAGVENARVQVAISSVGVIIVGKANVNGVGVNERVYEEVDSVMRVMWRHWEESETLISEMPWFENMESIPKEANLSKGGAKQKGWYKENWVDVDFFKEMGLVGVVLVWSKRVNFYK